jgi:hypothetical protein
LEYKSIYTIIDYYEKKVKTVIGNNTTSTFHLFSGLLENITSGNNSHFIGHGALEYHVITMPENT